MAVGDAERRISPIPGPRTMMLLVHERGFAGQLQLVLLRQWAGA
jgi:hypothetical protein